MGVRKVNPGGFEHAWQIAQTAVDLGMRLPGWEVLSERELRAIEAENEKLFASVQVGDIAGRPQMHRPDLVLVSSGGRVVPVEVELSHKAPGRLDAICRGWARARHIGSVYYLAAPRPTRALERSTRRVNALDRICVLPVEDTAGLAERELAIERSVAPVVQGLAREEASDVRL
jgi:hypothetical protein